MRPTTLAEARLYRYGKWAGNERGRAYAEGDCIQEFTPNERGGLPRQCSNRATQGPDKAWCHTHNPDRITAQKNDEEARRAAIAKRQDVVRKHGEALIKRLGCGSIYFDLRSFLYTRHLVIPFERVEELLDKASR